MKSFATGVRDALVREDSLRVDRSCCNIASLSGFVLGAGTLSLLGGGRLRLAMRFEHPGTVRLVVSRLRALLSVMPGIRMLAANKLGGRRSFEIRIEGEDARRALSLLHIKALGMPIPRHCAVKKCCREAFLRAMFLASGTIADPARSYQMEFVLSNEGTAEALRDHIAAFYAIRTSVVERRSQHVVYSKDADSIISLLSVMGATVAIFAMEDARILRDARNRANRAANCDAGNITKMLSASMRQQQAIEKIERTIGIDALPESLRAVAIERRLNPDISLEEIGERLSPPIGKSGVHHRLRRVEAISQSIEEPITHKEELP